MLPNIKCIARGLLSNDVSVCSPPSESDKVEHEEQDAEETAPLPAPAASVSAVSSIGGEQTTLVQNEEEAFALEPLDITSVPGIVFVKTVEMSIIKLQ